MKTLAMAKARAEVTMIRSWGAHERVAVTHGRN
jgi:hypothetical protein